MATHFHSSHDGLDRVIDGTSAAKSVFSDIFSAKRLPTYVLGVAIMAVVTATERALDPVQTGFAFEWAILTLVALASFALLARVIVRSTRATQVWLAEYAKQVRQARSDAKLWDTARRDPRVMNEVLLAQGRTEQTIDEVQPSQRTKPTVNGAVNDDGLAPLAPWVQLTRYY